MTHAIDPGRLCVEDARAMVDDLNEAIREIVLSGVEAHDEHTRLLSYKRALELITGVVFCLDNALPTEKGRAA